MSSTRFAIRRIACLALLLAATPTFAQVDLAGTWDSRSFADHMARGSGPYAVAYWGVPISSAARARALAYNSSVLAVLERQCLYYTPMYLLTGPQGIIFSSDFDPITGIPVALNIQPTIDRPPIKIWLDGRAEPGTLALHPAGGFASGKWVRGTLVAHISHIPESYIVRNGVPNSDQASMTLFISRHGDLLSVTGILEDPVYLTEPYPVSQILKLDPVTNGGTSAAWRQSPCNPEIDVPGYSHDQVPNYLPGQNPSINEMTQLYHIPLDAVLGGAQTMYPEYRKTIKAAGYMPPVTYCKQYCCGWIGGGAPSRLLQCPKASGE
jgi:hypothetical protein